ncbi:MAG: SAM-dependent methyltransferase [Waddliaceae bacterium]
MIIISPLIILIIAWALGSIVIWSFKNGISPMPSTRLAQRAMLQLIPGTLSGKVYELGSGWGTLAFLLAKRLPHCQVISYENSPVPYFFSKLRHFFVPLSNLSLNRKDFFRESLEDASLIICYLYPGAMKTLRTKFEKELKAKTRIISNTFAIPGWTPEQVQVLPDLYKSKIYLYKVSRGNHTKSP